MKIETVPLAAKEDPERFRLFVKTLMKLERGQSFLVDDMKAAYKTAAWVLGIAHDRKFSITAEGNKHRAGRIT